MPLAIVLALLLVIGVGFTVLAGAGQERPAVSPVPGPPPAPPPPGPVPLRAVGSMVFARTDAAGITLDCLLAVQDGRPGTIEGTPPTARPVTLHVRRPSTRWFSSRVEELLRQWAAEDRLVEVGLRHGRRDRAELWDGRCRIILDVDELDGLAA